MFSAGRLARQSNSTSKKNDDSEHANTGSSRQLKLSHGLGAQRVVVNQISKQFSTGSSSEQFSNSTRVTSSADLRNEKSETALNQLESPSEPSVAAPAVHGPSLSVAEIRSLVQSSRWDKRVSGFEAVNVRFMKWLNAFHDPRSGTSNFPPYLEEFLDLCVQHMTDSHQKVVCAVTTALETLCRSQPNPLISHRMSVLLATLLSRLADRKASLRSQASTLLDMIRESYDAPHIVAALSPRMAELPERTRISVVQFLSSLVPFCENYFNIHLNMASFLNRLAIVLGQGGGAFAGSNNRASTSLIIAGQRVLELLYGVSKDVSIDY